MLVLACLPVLDAITGIYFCEKRCSKHVQIMKDSN